MIDFLSLRKAQPDKNEHEVSQQAAECKLLLENPVFAEVVNELWIELAYAETEALNHPTSTIAEAKIAADTIRNDRLALERLVSRISDNLKYIEIKEEEEADDEEAEPSTTGE